MSDAPNITEAERDEFADLTPEKAAEVIRGLRGTPKLTAEEVRALDSFKEDERDVKAALINARRFAKPQGFADRTEANEAADAIKDLKEARKAAEARKLTITQVWRDNTGAVNAEYKELLSPTKAAEEALKRAGLTFVKREREEQEAVQRAEQERLDREAEQKAADSAEAAKLAAAEPENPEAQELAVETFNEAANAASATAPAPPPPPKNLRGAYGLLSSYGKWKFDVTDPGAVPRQHLMPNEKSIGAAVQAEAQLAKAQGREFKLEIPGVRIYADEIGMSR
jgi:hypothetical protein